VGGGGVRPGTPPNYRPTFPLIQFAARTSCGRGGGEYASPVTHRCVDRVAADPRVSSTGGKYRTAASLLLSPR